MVPIVYHPGFNISAFGLERLHPFDSRKYRRIHDRIIACGLRRPNDFIRPRRVQGPELRSVHTERYLRSLRSTRVLAGILELPVVGWLPRGLVRWRILKPMALATGGTILACRLALERGLAINLGGGYHHAGPDFGGGFCVFADVPIASAVLHSEGRLGRVLVVDLDAHQGDGTASAFQGWPWAFIADLYQHDLFPFRKAPEDFAWPVPPGMVGHEYLDLIHESLPALLDDLKPDLLIYNAGSDPYVFDPLAQFLLTADELAERDLTVVTLARERGIPVAMVLSGGYAPDSWRVHADAIEGILTRFDRT